MLIEGLDKGWGLNQLLMGNLRKKLDLIGIIAFMNKRTLLSFLNLIIQSRVGTFINLTNNGRVYSL